MTEGVKTPLLAPATKDEEEEPFETVVEFLARDVLWARDETHAMVMACCASHSFAELPMENQLASPWVLYNPLYWAVQVLMIICIVSGRWTHALVGQGGPVREDELPIEHEARVQWIYSTDGPFLMSAIFEVWYITYLAATGTLTTAAATTSIVDFGIDVVYVCGNVFFLQVLAKKDVLGIRIAIVANATFAIGLVLILTYGYFSNGGFTSMSYRNEANWFFRALMVLFFVAAAALYTQLWSAHGPLPSSDADDPAPASWKASRPLHYFVLALAAVAVWTLVALTVAAAGFKVIWGTVA